MRRELKVKSCYIHGIIEWAELVRQLPVSLHVRCSSTGREKEGCQQSVVCGRGQTTMGMVNHHDYNIAVL